MAGNGGAQGGAVQPVGAFAPSQDPINPALKPYGNALYNNPNAQGSYPGQQGWKPLASPQGMVNPHTGQVGRDFDPLAAAKASKGYVASPQQATNSYNFAPGQAGALGQDIQSIQQSQAPQGGFPPGAMSGAVGGAMSGWQPQQQAPQTPGTSWAQGVMNGWQQPQQQAPAALPPQLQQQIMGQYPFMGGGYGQGGMGPNPWGQGNMMQGLQGNPFLAYAMMNAGRGLY